MKSLKIVLASLFLTAGIITLSSFTADYKKNAFTLVCFEYATGQGALDPNEVKDPLKWTPVTTNTSTIQNTICPQSTYLCVICFDDSNFPGANAAARQLAAFNFLSVYFESHDIEDVTEALAFDVDPGSDVRNITVYKRAIQ